MNKLLIIVYCVGLLAQHGGVCAQMLNPPYFNLAEGRNITATSTCGENVPEPELYCKLVGTNWLDSDNVNLIGGQACDYCDPNDPNRYHPASNAIDGTERWWQSPPLSRGVKYNEVNLTIDLGQEFNVAYVFIKMGNSPRPGVWTLERSRDHGNTYSPWQYFADTPVECIQYFGQLSLQPITQDDSVICETKYSKLVPLEGGEMAVSLLNGRPSADNFSMSETLQEWSTATNIRLRFLRPKTTLGHLLSVERQDPTVTRRYFYSIKDINIGGRCVCNGHASQCDQASIVDPYKASCNCQHNTDGSQCEQCRAGYHQYKWRRATISDPFVCEKCNCNGHSEDCYYDEEVAMKNQSMNIHGMYEGGGVCQNCQHHTTGINCHECTNYYFRPYDRPIDAIDVCQPCVCDRKFSTGNCAEGSGLCECRKNYQAPNCDQCSYGYFGYPECQECHCYPNGTIGELCELTSGDCPCREGYGGQFCKECSEDYFGFPNCEPCQCDPTNSLNTHCNAETGQCECRANFGGRTCDKCSVGYYNYPNCEFCQCIRIGSTEEVCDPNSGKCFCKEGYDGSNCDRCAEGYYGFPNCTPCDCNKEGSAHGKCDKHGKCECKFNFGGLKCQDCSAGYYNFPKCEQCKCNWKGSSGSSCDHSGNCICKDHFEGQKCDQCKEGYYNFPNCEECNCNPAGLVAEFGGCDKVEVGKLCECKERVKGRICNQCKDLYWNLQMNNPAGCEECQCNLNGTISRIGHCESDTGACVCKPNVYGRTCNTCKRNTYALSADSLFGCIDCNCDVGGSISSECDKVTGQCQCKPRVKGRSCSETSDASYFPNFHQFLYEAEDWFNPTGSQARFGYDEQIFPNYSWRGYAVFSPLQQEIMTNISIPKRSIYKALVRYVNKNTQPVSGLLRFTPSEWMNEEEQSVPIVFEPTDEPKVQFAAGKQLTSGMLPLGFGPWHASLKADQPDVFVDYVVLVPQEYYDQSILQDQNAGPCLFGENNSTCLKQMYPKFPESSKPLYATDAFFIDQDDSQYKPQVVNEEGYKEKLNSDADFVKLNKERDNLEFDVPNENNGTYLMVLTYHTPDNTDHYVKSNVDLTKGNKTDTYELMLPACPYKFACRQIVTDKEGQIVTFEVAKDELHKLKISVDKNDTEDPNLNINQVDMIPVDTKWSYDYMTPKFVCLNKGSNCITPDFPPLTEGTKIEAELDKKDRAIEEIAYSYTKPNDNGTPPQLVKLNSQSPSIDIRGVVPEPGQYSFIAHYYQPDNPNFELEALIQDSHVYSGVAPIEHCPNTAGCRTVLKQKDNNSTFFFIEKNFMINLKTPPNADLALDYVLVVPGNSYDPNMLTQTSKDSKNKLAECFQNVHLQADPNEVDDHCKGMIFSIATDFNGGALPCQCNIDGSKDHLCNSFGGQCNCKPNVIGRDCSKCRTGYYGFPNCRKCDCPSTAICHPQSGDCICPKGVTGKDCDTCLPQTFGFDKIIGCVDCNCNPYGVQNHDLKCDLDTGNCNCKVNIVGRTCDKCKAGFYSFPDCQLCQCDIRGTTDQICDQRDARCFCKKNVDGYYCDKCRSDSYYLEESNHLGCTKCFCFGNTDQCTSSMLAYGQVSNINTDLELYNITVDEKELEKEIMVKNTDFELDYSDAKFLIRTNVLPIESDQIQSSIYISLPDEYLGKKINSYGGKFVYTIVNKVNAAEGYQSLSVMPGLLFVGKNFTLQHEHYEQPNINEEFHLNIDIKEKEFKHLDGNLVTREQLMMTLVDLKAIYLRVKYFDPVYTIELQNIKMDVAMAMGRHSNGTKALSVEMCRCPSNYKGTSCEECAEGYYRVKRGPYLGHCMPCQCNGHSNECDPVTGECHNCRFHTEGDHCDKCIEGYYGDATQGTPNDCMICACPLPIASNNFATSCEVSSSGSVLNCNCKEGYNGTRCDHCAAGHYGQPQMPGYGCRKCECNDNIDINDPESCNKYSGICEMCLHNTDGERCEHCASWFYGDAISAKNCTECACNQCGSESCNRLTGECRCKMNVVGETCDKCAEGFYGFNTCQGCQSCNCNEGAHDQNCDNETGQCNCKEGVAGKNCDTCKPGFWGFSKYGCTSCQCNPKFSRAMQCNQFTGRCQCLPNVVGEKCESCPDRWVLIPESGCQPCSDCVHVLLNDTVGLQDSINMIYDSMQDTSSAVLAYKKLHHVQAKYDNYTKQVQSTFEDTEEIDKKKKIFGDVREKLNNLSDDTDHMDIKSDSLSKDVNFMVEKAAAAFNESINFENTAKDAKQLSAQVIENINRLEHSYLNSTTAQSLERKEAEMEQILRDMKQENEARTYPPIDMESYNQTLENAKDFVKPYIKMKNDVEQTENGLKEMNNLVMELKNLTQKVREDTINSETVTRSRLKENMLDNMNRIDSVLNMTLDNLAKANQTLEDSKESLDIVDSMKPDIDLQKENLQAKFQSLNEFIRDFSQQVPDQKKDVNAAKAYAAQMQKQSDELSRQFEDTKGKANHSLQAANAYNQINEKVEESEKIVSEANQILTDIDNELMQSDEPMNPPPVDQTGEINKLKATYSRLNNEVEWNSETINTGDSEFQQVSQAMEKIQNTQDKYDSRAEIIGESVAKVKIPVEKIDILLDQVENLKPETVAIKEYEEFSNVVKDSADYLKQVNSLETERLSSQLANKYDELSNAFQNTKSEISDKIVELKKSIQLARQYINNLELGAQVDDESELELNPPASIADSSLYTKVSMQFKANTLNGLLAYIGNPMSGYRAKRDFDSTPLSDFMSLELIDGYVVLGWQFKDGEHEYLRNEQPISPYKWHQVIMERYGRVVKLLVIADNKRKETQKIAPLSSVVFNLNPETARIFIGSIPSKVLVQREVRREAFRGTVSNVQLNNEPLSLWNAKESKNIRGDSAGPRGQQPEDNLRFKGNSFVILRNEREAFLENIFISFDFKTYAPDGLMFLVGDPASMNFFSVEINNGKVVVKYNLGSATTTVTSANDYNDGRWHFIKVNRETKDCILTIDNSDSQNAFAEGWNSDLLTDDNIYIGGFEGQVPYKDVIQKGFEGCIKDLQIGMLPQKLSENKKSYDVSYDCKTDLVRVVSFGEHANTSTGYVLFENQEITAGESAMISFRFRTLHKNGLLLYQYSSDALAPQFTVSLMDGKLVVANGNERSIKTERYFYNDNKWHSVSIELDSNQMVVVVDDEQRFESENPSSETFSVSNIFVGGVSEVINSIQNLEYFVGCIGDIHLNNDYLNFANADKKFNVQFGSCPLSETGEKFPLKPDESYVPATIIPRPLDVEYLPPEGNCKLPQVPRQQPFSSDMEEVRFGNTLYSRYEFPISNDVAKGLENESGFQVKFKTSQPSGILFYLASGPDFVGLYFLKNHLHYSFDCGSGRAVVRIKKDFADGQWHSAIFFRKGNSGYLRVDGEMHEISHPGEHSSLNVKSPIYLGGVPEDLTQQVKSHLKSDNKNDYSSAATTSFSGCLKDFQIRDMDYRFKDGRPVDVAPCSDQVDYGHYFHYGGGHIRLRENFRVLMDFKLTLEIKPRKQDGILVAVFSSKNSDYLVLYTDKGSITLTVDNGAGSFAASVNMNGSICDGEWHKIDVLKTLNTALLTVDTQPAAIGFGRGGVSSTDTDDPLYLGGLPDNLKEEKIKQLNHITDNYLGCMRVLSLNDEKQPSMSASKVVGHVTLNTCPSN